MTASELERQIAAAIGESRNTVRARGFSLVEPPRLAPLVIDWDLVYPTDARRRVHRPARRRKATN